MAAIQLYGGKILTADGKIAGHEDCCCGLVCQQCLFCTEQTYLPDFNLHLVNWVHNVWDQCATCNLLNDTYVLDQIYDNPSSLDYCCCKYYELPAAICGVEWIGVVFWWDNINQFLVVSVMFKTLAMFANYKCSPLHNIAVNLATWEYRVASCPTLLGCGVDCETTFDKGGAGTPPGLLLTPGLGYTGGWGGIGQSCDFGQFYLEAL